MTQKVITHQDMEVNQKKDTTILKYRASSGCRADLSGQTFFMTITQKMDIVTVDVTEKERIVSEGWFGRKKRIEKYSDVNVKPGSIVLPACGTVSIEMWDATESHQKYKTNFPISYSLERKLGDAIPKMEPGDVLRMKIEHPEQNVVRITLAIYVNEE